MMRNQFAETKNVLRKRIKTWTRAVSLVLGLTICLGWAAQQAAAQTAGEGSILGTVKDSSGAVIGNAKITATDNATKVATLRSSSSAGFFTISPIPPGTYTISVTAKGFKMLVQDNVVVDALSAVTFDPVLTVGAESQTVVVTSAPPTIDTVDATLGLTMENESYSNLPLQMNGTQRDPTAFGVLTPGSQGANNGGRLPIIGGTGSYLGQLYLDGMPAQTVSQQGDNRLVSLSMDLDAVDQFQYVTSSPPAEYMGAGAENFTMKSGGTRYHGQFSDFARNTAFDTWAFTAKAATTHNAAGQLIQAPKPVEHQNEMSVSVGGFVPRTGKKLFFFFAYDKYHYRKGASYSLYTIPTTAEVQGDFTELVTSSQYPTGNPVAGQSGTGSTNPAFLYNPLSNSCTGSTCTRAPFQAVKPGGSAASNNVIPSSMISPIAKAMQSFLPAPTNPGVLVNNYLGGYPGGFDNHATDWRVDYDLSSKQRLSSVGVMGVENYLNNYGSPFLPPPYIGGDLASIYPKDYVAGHTYTFSPNVVNQVKFSYTRFFQNIHDATQGVTAWEPATLGMTNIPAGQGGQEFPGASFGTTTGFGTAIQTWTGNGSSISTQLTTPNNYATTDNLQWLKGKHSFTFGLTYQWQNINNSNPATYSSVMDFAYNAYSTANYGANSSGLSLGGSGYTGTSTGQSGYSYASYLLGAVGGSPSLALQPVSEEGGRYKTIAPYAEDIYKLTPKLTLDLGLRWDYLPPYHEVKNRWTFMNPSLTNPLTGTPGLLEFAGNYGGSGVSCGCKTPVQTYWKNWGPRVSFAYEMNPKTVFRAGFAQVFSQGGGVGGRGGASGGTGQTGFNMSALGPTEATTGVAAAPSFWLNNSSAFSAAGVANTNLYGPGYAYPAAPTPGVAAQELNTGNYVNSANKVASPGSVSYADPYLSGRAPTFEMWNAGFERGLTSDLTLAVNYVGNESHFIINSGTNGSNARGYWAGQLDPKYLANLGPVTDSTGKIPLLNAPATQANVAVLESHMAGSPNPAFIQAAAALSSSVTMTQMLLAFPQYSGVSDTWGNVGNFTYESLQVTLNQRMSHGLTFNFNYTFSKNIGDDGSYRSGYAIPAGALSNGTKSNSTAWKQDRIDRSWTVISIPNKINAFGVYQLPFGKGHIGSDSRLVRWAAGGWQLSGIYTFSQGTPMTVTWSGCSATTYPGQGQCMPDLNPNYTSASVRMNGKWGKGPAGYNTCNLGINALGQTNCKAIPYIDVNSLQAPPSISTVSAAQLLIGDAPRTKAWGLRNPYTWNFDSGLRRTFPIHDSLNFVFEADCLNTFNHVTFGGPSASWSSGSAAFGTIGGASGNRDFQFAGHINF